jgi:hypothetical protein
MLLFIHLGEDVVIRSEDVIAILDGQVVEAGDIIQEFLDSPKNKKSIISISEGYVKSIVVTINNIYFSPLSSVTLKKRSQMISELVTPID